DLTGITTTLFTTTTLTYLTAEFSLIATTSTMREDFAGETGFMAIPRVAGVSQAPSMASVRRMASLVIIPERSADLIMEA
ncbi:MAG TPA: hypothetical protein VIH54_20970, partial [Chthoniobacterales bacterium]